MSAEVSSLQDQTGKFWPIRPHQESLHKFSKPFNGLSVHKLHENRNYTIVEYGEKLYGCHTAHIPAVVKIKYLRKRMTLESHEYTHTTKHNIETSFAGIQNFKLGSDITAKLQWLEHLWDHGKVFEPWVVRAMEG